jgi:hypothetical protein
MPLFRRPAAPKTAWEIISWWEARRIPYNLIVGISGLISILPILGTAFVTDRLVGEPAGLPDPPFFAFLGVVAYGVAANICFTGGWILELVSRRVWGERAEAFGEIAFALGTLGSVVLTFVPAALIVAVGTYTVIAHGWIK